jgi:hypothetical protein
VEAVSPWVIAHRTRCGHWRLWAVFCAALTTDLTTTLTTVTRRTTPTTPLCASYFAWSHALPGPGSVGVRGSSPLSSTFGHLSVLTRTPMAMLRGQDVGSAPDALNRIGLATLTTLCAPDPHEATALSLLRFGSVGLPGVVCRPNQGRTHAVRPEPSCPGRAGQQMQSFAGRGSDPLGRSRPPPN